MNTQTLNSRQTGMVLVISLILLLVLTLVAVIAMRSTSVDLQMTTNTMLQTRAFQGSESGRGMVASSGELLGNHVFYRGWPGSTEIPVPTTSNFTALPDGISIVDNTAELYIENNADMGDLSAGAVDMRYQIDGSDPNNTSFDDQEDINADIFVTKLATVAAPGSGTAQVSGYEGIGAGAAGGGAHVYFDIRSRATAPGNARSVTGVDYRAVVIN